jgi:hypothetical protein
MRLTVTKSYQMWNLDHFSRLTHLCMPYHGRRVHMMWPTLGFQSLQMFVIAIRILFCDRSSRVSLQSWVQSIRETDTRVYLVDDWSADIQVEWEREMRGGESVWERAIRYTSKWEAYGRVAVQSAKVRDSKHSPRQTKLIPFRDQTHDSRMASKNAE